MKQRIDRLLVELGYFATREKARRAVMAGEVFAGTTRINKPAELFDPADAAQLTLKRRDHAVSRAYYKLQKALQLFCFETADKVCIDIGSSTGGFTQLLLENGAAIVYAVDSGTNQLDYSLRRDPRVRVMEQTNARKLSAEQFVPAPVLAVMDVSFISVRKLIPVLVEQLRVEELVVLIKPQFEAGREAVGKGGIVRDKRIHRELLDQILQFGSETGLSCRGMTWSPVKGMKGNVEYLVYWKRDMCDNIEVDTAGLVEQAHAEAE